MSSGWEREPDSKDSNGSDSTSTEHPPKQTFRYKALQNFVKIHTSFKLHSLFSITECTFFILTGIRKTEPLCHSRQRQFLKKFKLRFIPVVP